MEMLRAGGIFLRKETTEARRQAFGKDRKEEVALFGWNCQMKLKIEMWVPFLKSLTFDQQGQRDPRHLCPLPPGLSLPPKWPAPQAERLWAAGRGCHPPRSLYSKYKPFQTIRQYSSGIFRLSWHF